MKTEKFKSCHFVELSQSELHEINGGIKIPSLWQVANELYENGAAYWEKFKNGFLTGLK